MATLSMSTKAFLRKETKNRLKQMTQTNIQCQSDAVAEMVFSLPIYQHASSVSVYLSMHNELNTTKIIQHAFNNKKRVFIPKVTGSNSDDMTMIELESFEDIERFPKNNWGIPEPTLEYLHSHSSITSENLVDIVFVPGVLFDKIGGRIGHGKGYYGESF